jgi:hypothetical protein
MPYNPFYNRNLFLFGQEPPKIYDVATNKESASSEHAAWMRSKRKPRPVAEAIIAVRGHNNPADHPYTVAEKILPRVNAWLKERGHGPVSPDTVGKKIPRS